MTEFRFWVSGVPATQGSKTAYVRSGRAVMVESNKRLPEWRLAVSTAAKQALLDADQLTGPIKLVATFYLPRPIKPKWANYPASKPDLDKLLRAINDGCSGILFKDDAQIVEITARKLWAGLDEPEPGCHIYLVSK